MVTIVAREIRPSSLVGILALTCPSSLSAHATSRAAQERKRSTGKQLNVIRMRANGKQIERVGFRV